MVTVQGEGCVHGHRGQGLLEGEAHAEAAQGHREGQGRREAAPGVDVRGQGHGRARVHEGAGGRETAEPQVEGGRGQEGGHAGGGRQRLHPRRRDVDQVVGRAGPQLRRQLGPAGMGQLVGAETQLDPPLARGPQDAPALLDREHASLAEDVAELGQAPLGHRGDHLLHQQVDVARSPGAMLGRHLVGAEERGDDRDGMSRARPADRLQRAQLGRGLEPVAALHLGGGGAAGEHLVEAGGDRGLQFFDGRASGGGDGLHDATSRGRDLLVSGPRQAPADLPVPVARESQVGMGVHEARDDRRAVGVDDRPVGSEADGIVDDRPYALGKPQL